MAAKGFTIIGTLVLVVITAAISGGGIYLWQQQTVQSNKQQLASKQSEIDNLQNQLEETQIRQQEEQTRMETAPPQNFAGATVPYANAELGIEFQYPASYNATAAGREIAVKSKQSARSYSVIATDNRLNLGAFEQLALDLLDKKAEEKLITRKEVEISGSKAIDAEFAQKDGARVRRVYLPIGKQVVKIQYRLTNLPADPQEPEATYLQNGAAIVNSVKASSPSSPQAGQ